MKQTCANCIYWKNNFYWKKNNVNVKTLYGKQAGVCQLHTAIPKRIVAEPDAAIVSSDPNCFHELNFITTEQFSCSGFDDGSKTLEIRHRVPINKNED